MKSLIILAISILIIILSSCRQVENKTIDPEIVITNASGLGQTFEISFRKGATFSHPIIAIWLETADGKYIQSLYVSKSIATGFFEHGDNTSGKWVPGTRRRAAAIPYWAHKRAVKEVDGLYIPTPATAIPDAYTGPTPLQNFVLKSKSDSMLNKPIRVLLEINQVFDWNSHWTTTRYPNDSYYATSGQPSLIYSTDNIDLNALVESYLLKLIGHGQASGITGELFSDVSGHTTALEIVNEVVVRVR